MNTLMKSLLILVLAMFVIVSCDDMTPEPKSIEESKTNDDDDDDNDDDELVSFSGDVIPIFESNCAGCHGGSLAPNLSENQHNNLVDDYVKPGEPEESTLYNKISGTHGGLDDEEIELIKQWITEGALDN